MEYSDTACNFSREAPKFDCAYRNSIYPQGYTHRGRIIGLWQYDPGNARIAHWLFAGATPAVSRRIAEVEAWIRDGLGDFRSFSLDSPSSRQDRIDALDAAG